jgi:uncharacterized protein (DUF4415 family)
LKKLKKPTKKEDAAIARAVENDLDTWEATPEHFANARRGRPFSQSPKMPVSIRLDAEIVEHFKASGKGWQSRINALLAEHVKRAG